VRKQRNTFALRNAIVGLLQLATARSFGILRDSFAVAFRGLADKLPVKPEFVPPHVTAPIKTHLGSPFLWRPAALLTVLPRNLANALDPEALDTRTVTALSHEARRFARFAFAHAEYPNRFGYLSQCESDRLAPRLAGRSEERPLRARLPQYQCPDATPEVAIGFARQS